MLPRAFRAVYPPGSTFEVITGLAALLSNSITLHSRFDCPSTFRVGNSVFHNWKKYDVGTLDFFEALVQSCNTWFYQVGLRTGAVSIITLAQRLGLGSQTGIPIRAGWEYSNKFLYVTRAP
jgi:penicillin-binding protein 2